MERAIMNALVVSAPAEITAAVPASGPAWLPVLTFGMLVGWPEHLTPERARGGILVLRDCTAFSAVGADANEYAFHSGPYVPVTVAWAPSRAAVTCR
jgi:hypothetical protein